MDSIKVWLGTKMKLVLNIIVDGITLNGSNCDNYDLRFVLSNGAKKVSLAMGDLIIGSGNELMLPIDTSVLGKGTVLMTTYVSVPDNDFSDGHRVEVDRQNILYIKDV